MASSMISEGPYSYAEQSSYQRIGIESAMTILCKEISEHFDARHLLSSSAHFNVVDLGCSIGPNTFYVVDSILKAVKIRFCSEGINIEKLETQVFFNDQATNDFNALFNSLPSHRQYYAMGVPGSFNDRLFPKASVHIMHSSYALHWLSRVPGEVVDEASIAWNKGKVVYESKEVQAAYLAQFMKDMESFLAARAEELVQGGIMAILIPSVPDGVDPLESGIIRLFKLLGSTLMDMVKMGLVDAAKVDSFNFPIYCPSSRELEAAVEENGSFTIIRREHLAPPNGPAEAQKGISNLRSVVDKPLAECFGNEIMDELFDRLVKKATDVRLANHPTLLLILKRK